MTAKTKSKSAILDAVHETAGDLHKAGFIDGHQMKHYDALCSSPVPTYSGDDSKAARNLLSRDNAQQTDRHVSSNAVISRLESMLSKAKAAKKI